MPHKKHALQNALDLKTVTLSETTHCGIPKQGENISTKQLTTASEDIFLTGYKDTNLEKPSKTA
jgi:hypothetical protein